MTLDDWLAQAGALWLLAAVVLGLAELVIPGVFVIFLAIAAAITGAAMLALPTLPLAAQLGSFAVWSVVSVLIGKRWYVDYPVATTDPLLNDRAARMIGATVIADTVIDSGSGRVRYGDGVWPARGPASPAGTRLRVIAVENMTLVVAPLDDAAHLASTRTDQA